MKRYGGWWLPQAERHLLTEAKWHEDGGRLRYQAEKQRLFLAHCRGFRTVVDCGAHVGLWSWYLAKWFDLVLAFEPVAAHRACFLRNLEGTDNVTLYDCALGERSGTVGVRVGAKSSGATHIEGDGDIPLRRLDDFELRGVDGMKLDNEGYELFALRGAAATIARCRPTIIVEQKPGNAQRFGLPERGAVEYLESLGYRLAAESAGDFVMVPQ